MNFAYPRARSRWTRSPARTWQNFFIVPLVGLGSLTFGIGVGLFLSSFGGSKEFSPESIRSDGSLAKLVTARPIEPAGVEPLRAAIQGDAWSAPWTTVPWLTSIADARKKA